MAVTLDTTTSSNGASSTSWTFSHTCSGSDRVLLVGFFKFASGDSVTGVTYGGVAMTQLGKRAADASGYIYLYGLVNPATGANNVVATSSASVEWYGEAVSYNGVNQTTPFPDTAVTSTSTGTSFTGTITTTVADSWVVLQGRNSVGGPTAGANTTLRVASPSPDVWFLDSNAGRATGSNNLAWSFGTSETCYWIIGAVAPSASASGPANLKSLNTNIKANIKSYNTNLIANIKSINTNV